MKRTSWLLFSSLGAAALATLPAACISNTSNPPGPDDAGFVEGTDAGQPVNGSDATAPNDDSGIDSGVDAPIDTAPQPLTLTVLAGGAPESGINVVFQDDTGAVITTLQTGASGSVSQLVTAGSQVTVVLGTATEASLLTIQGVAPGDAITVDDTSGQTPPLGELVTTTLPAGTWDASAVGEQVSAGTCSNASTNPIYMNYSCQSNGLFPLLARAVDSTSEQEIAYTYQTGNKVSADGGLPDDDSTLPVVVSRAWSTSSALETVAWSNVPAALFDGGAGADVTPEYFEVAGGVAAGVSGSNLTTDDAGSASEQFVIHSGYPDFVQAGAYVLVESKEVVSYVGGATHSLPPTASQSVSFDLSTLPVIMGASIDTTDAGTPSQPSVTWTTAAGSSTAANGIYVSTQWYGSVVTEAGTQYSNGTWTIIAPPTATSVRTPALPSQAAAWAPPPGATWEYLPRVAIVQASFLPGYAGLRAAVGTLPLLQGYEIAVPVLPVNGTIYVSAIYPDEG